MRELVAAALIALHPALITETSNIATETLYMFFLALGLWLYIEYVVGPADSPRTDRLSAVVALVLAAIAFGLATLTRGVSALFPLVLALHLMWLGRQRLHGNWRRHCLLLLTVYAAIVSTWTIYNLVYWDRLVIVSDQLMAALWRGAEINDGSPEHNDKLLMVGVEDITPVDCAIDCKFQHSTETYINKIRVIVSTDPAGFFALRANELAYAILQPYGTTPFGDISIVEAGRRWVSDDRSLDGLLRIMRIEGFATKFAFWIFHYIAIGFGLLGLILSRRRWRTAAPLAGFAIYTIVVHFFLLATAPLPLPHRDCLAHFLRHRHGKTVRTVANTPSPQP